MYLDIFMRELSYEEIEQQVAYDMTNLWSKTIWVLMTRKRVVSIWLTIVPNNTICIEW